ncbi:MAG: AI-2E family transporter [Pseudobdellovibrionaceae bacterium]
MIPILKSQSVLVQWLLFLIFFGAFVYINAPFTTPFILAGIFALGLNDFVDRICKATRFRRNICIVLTLFSGFALFWAPLSIAVYRVTVYLAQPQSVGTDKIINQIKNLNNFLITHLHDLSVWTGHDLAEPVKNISEDVLNKVGAILLKKSTEFLGQLPSTLLATFVFAILVFLLLLRSAKIKEFVVRNSVLNRELTEKLIHISKYSCSATLFSTLVIGTIQACIIGLGSLIFGEGDFWLVLTVTFFVSFIPVIGAAPVGFLLAILAFIGGRIDSGIGLVVVATIASSIDYILKPLLVGKENKISPVIGFTSVVGAVFMVGLPGLLIGPVVMNLFIGTSPLLLRNNDSET